MKHLTFDEGRFHDAFLVSIDFKDWTNKIVLLFWCPNAGEEWEDGRFMQLTVEALVFFGFEAGLMGLSGSGEPVMFFDIGLENQSHELDIWQSRYREIEQSGATYPEIARAAKGKHIYHFVLDGYAFGGRAFLKKGFQIMCEHFSVSDVTESTPPETPRCFPHTIEAGD